MIRSSEIRLGMFISGGGTTMEAIGKACSEGGPLYGKVKPVIVIADRACGGVEKAQALGIPVSVIKRTDFPKGPERTMQHGEKVLEALRRYAPDVITQNGWLSLTSPEIIEAFEQRIFNQHPAPLDPDTIDAFGEPLHFGGKGIFGRAAHASVLEFQHLTGRVFPTEATIHRVTSEFDQGAVVYRQEVPAEPDDTAETLASRVLPYEHGAHIIFLNNLFEGEVPNLCRLVPLVQSGEEHLLYQAKYYAREQYPKG